MPEPSRSYTVYVDDNFHYGDASERSTHSVHGTVDEAMSACRRIVEESLQALLEPGMNSGKLMAQYVQFGDDPWIFPAPEAGFSARDYARGRCKELCRAEDAREERARGPRVVATPQELPALKPVIAAALTRRDLTAEYRQLLELMRSRLDDIPRSFPDRSFTLIVKPRLGHAGGFSAYVFRAELRRAAFKLYWGTWAGRAPAQGAACLAELRSSFHETGEGDTRAGDPAAMLGPMARAAADETFMLIVTSEDSD